MGFITKKIGRLNLIIRLLDVLMILICFIAAYYWRHGFEIIPVHYFYALVIILSVSVLMFSIFDSYKNDVKRQTIIRYRRVGMAWLMTLMVVSGLAYLTKSGSLYSRQFFVVFGLSTGFGFVLIRLICEQFFLNSTEKVKAIVLGNGDAAFDLVDKLLSVHWLALDIVSIYDDADEQVGNTHRGVKVVGDTDDLLALLAGDPDSEAAGIQLEGVKHIWVTLPMSRYWQIEEILKVLDKNTISIHFILDLSEFGVLNNSIESFMGNSLVSINTSPVVGLGQSVKRTLDVVIATVAMILLAPVMLVIALLIKMDSKGPVLFKQARNGLDGSKIRMRKFRSMAVCDHNEDTVVQAQKNDVRVTRIGAFLRRTSLDELPQLLNVIEGDMSIVGPRPHAVAHNVMYGKLIRQYSWRHKVKPGITGLAQANGYRGETQHISKMQMRVNHDLEYIKEWTVWLDIKIIFKTLFHGMVGKNVY